MVKSGVEIAVYDAKTSEEITPFAVLTQIIFEQEQGRAEPTADHFPRRLIRFYGDSMQMLVPRYLEVSIKSLTRGREKFRQQMAQAFALAPSAGGTGAAEHGNVRARICDVCTVCAAGKPEQRRRQI